jgi:hypothetical protein
MAATIAVYAPLDQRPVKNTVVLFDVDDTLTKPRQVCGLLPQAKEYTSLLVLQLQPNWTDNLV